ncbi:hypothetical protein [Streptomyces bicolor]|uniref:hypothetical protein n=1 Tax=Streptomyces bicolor TaxID=66874 RepID=UPI0004E2305C|nr:hypothetical protein [Streptomyces bicolor]
MPRNVPFASSTLIVLAVLVGVFATVDSTAHSRPVADAAPNATVIAETVTWGPCPEEGAVQ